MYARISHYISKLDKKHGGTAGRVGGVFLCYMEKLETQAMVTGQPIRESENLTPERIALARRHLKEVLASPPFSASKRAQDFLQLVVGHALAGQVDSLRERMIGAEMFGR